MTTMQWPYPKCDHGAVHGECSHVGCLYSGDDAICPNADARPGAFPGRGFGLRNGEQTMKSYHFDLGDTNNGCIGMCASVIAPSKPKAIRLLRDAFKKCVSHLTWEDGTTIGIRLVSSEVEYFHVYINLDNLKIADIDDAEAIQC